MDLDELLNPARLRSVWRDSATSSASTAAPTLDCTQIEIGCPKATDDNRASGMGGDAEMHGSGNATDSTATGAEHRISEASLWAQLNAFTTAVERAFGADSEAHRVLKAMLSELKTAIAQAPRTDDANARPMIETIADFEAMLDRIEDVLTAFFYGAGWQTLAESEAG